MQTDGESVAGSGATGPGYRAGSDSAEQIGRRLADGEHLSALSIAYYVWGGFFALFAFFPLIYVLMGGMFLFSAPRSRGGPPPEAFGVFMIVFGLVFSAIILLQATLSLLSGFAIQKRRWLPLIYVGAALACLSVPMGTLLGVFTFLVISRPSARELFASAPNPPSDETHWEPPPV